MPTNDAKNLFDNAEESRNRSDGLREIAKRDARNRELISILKESEKRIQEQSSLIATYESLSQKSLSPIKILPRKKKSRRSHHTAVALASDWHSCENVYPDEVDGLNEHNVEIGQERASKYFRDLARLIKDEQVRFRIDDLVLWLGGDFMVGELHGIDSARACSMSPLAEVRHIKGLLTSGIDYLLREIDCKIRIVTSFGNHGRSTDKQRFQSAADYSYEQAIYIDLARTYSNEKRIDFDVRPMFYKTTDIAGYKILFTHGDQGFRYFGGVGGLTVPLLRQIPRWLKTYDFDLVCMGHYHTRIHLREAQVNGCLVGYDSYAAGKGFGFEPPSQTFFLVDHERRDVGTIRPIWVD